MDRQDHPGRHLGHNKNRRPAPRVDRGHEYRQDRRYGYRNDHRSGYRHDRRNWNRDFRSGPPRRFHQDHYNRYRAYNYGRVYHRGHGHYHAGYRFPYWASAGYWTYRPYYYCGDRLYASGRIELFGPNFGISVGF